MYAPCSPDKGEAPPIELMEHWSPSADTLRGTVPEPPFFALCSWMGTEASGRFSLNGFWSIGWVSMLGFRFLCHGAEKRSGTLPAFAHTRMVTLTHGCHLPAGRSSKVNWMNQVNKSLDDLLDRFRSRVQTRGRSVTAMVIDNLPTHPIVDTPSSAHRYDVTAQTAHEALVRLAEAGIRVDRSFSHRKKGRPRRVFAAAENHRVPRQLEAYAHLMTVAPG